MSRNYVDPLELLASKGNFVVEDAMRNKFYLISGKIYAAIP